MAGEVGMKMHEKIKCAREKMGWDIVDLATYAGLRIERTGEIDDGLDEPKMSELTKIADALHRSVDFFLSEDEPDDPICLHCKDMCSTCRQDETTCKDVSSKI